MRIIFVGDVVGNSGTKMLEEYLPQLKRKYRPQLTIVNGENATRGRGINEIFYKRLMKAGADVITMEIILGTTLKFNILFQMPRI